MSQRPILVFGASGRHGGTGYAVAKGLLEQGYPVRLISRQKTPDFGDLIERGAEQAQADLRDRPSLLPALKDVETAFFVYPINGGIVEAAANFASAGRDSGLKRVVVMSMGPAHPFGPSHLGRAQWLAEEIFRWAGFSCINLRIMAFFYENLALQHATEIREESRMENSFADLPLPWISASDAGRIALHAITHPDRFDGQTDFYPIGGEFITHTQIADLFSKKLGRAIQFRTISQAEWQARMEQRVGTDPRINPDMAKHISTMGASLTEVPPVTMLVPFQALTHESPMPLAQWVEQNIKLFQ